MPEAPSPRLIATARSNDSLASSDYYPPSRYEDLKGEQVVTSMTAFVQPREVPMPGQEQIGFGGMPVRGQLFPPPRAHVAPPVELASGEKTPKALSGSKKAPSRSISVDKRSIGNPVLQQGGTNPLDKVATTDLATAVQMEKDRRALMAAQGAAMPVSVDTSTSPETGLVRSTTLVRKQTSASTSQPKELDATASATASTTGAQLSPAGDELRRRSPRSSPTTSLTRRSSSIARTPSPPLKSAARYAPQQDGQGGFVQPMRSPRMPPPSAEPVPAETTMQQLAPAGLPMNQRAASIKRQAEEAAGNSRQETVMFVNNIVYNDPDFVASVMDDAKDRGLKAYPPPPPPPLEIPSVKESSFEQGPRSAASIVNRPRPIPRKHVEEYDGTFYPPKNLKRSRSLGNLLQRKSMLQSAPGSPTTLPPLPPPPQSAKGDRPHPNDTKSMTFDEKVRYMFPPAQGAPADRYQRRSSVPDIQTSFMDDSPTLADTEARDGLYRDSKRTTTSVRTRDVFGEPDRSTRGVSYVTYQSFIDEAQQGSPEESPHGGVGMTHNTKRASSPVLPTFSGIKSASTVMSYDDEIATNLDSVYSPLPIQQVGLTVHQARAIEVVNPNRPADTRAVSAVTNSEEMTIMLDASVAREFQGSQDQDGPMSPVDDGSPVEETTRTRSSGAWHRRVGEETLSFVKLSDKRGSRREPPPQSLILSERPTPAKQASIVQAAELSPLPSPEEALKIIQAQLKKYEQPHQGSTQSPGRLALLNDLEAEMGMQETRWLGMQNEFSRDSISTFAMSPTAESRRASATIEPEASLSRNSSLRSDTTADSRASLRRTRLAGLMSERSSISMAGVPLGSRASLWQKRLADAHQEYMQSTYDLSRKPSRNFLDISSHMSSPTPPDSDETEADIETRRNFAAILAAREKMEREQQVTVGLWTAPPAPEVRDGLIWSRPEKPYHVTVDEPALPGLSVRPAQRKENTVLSIESSQLWQKPASNETSSSGLWACAKETEEPEEDTSAPLSRVQSFYKPGIQRSRTSPSARPLTQRPARRTKRMTGLPDIVEDPQPLPDKRDTLGIFQFPWGEKSDQPSVPERQMFMAMPGTMSTRLSTGQNLRDARSRQLEETEYSSSFFDEYDDDEEGEKYDDSSSMGSDSDDEGFDETTLFEIASLLKTDGVPSTRSFFGQPRETTSEVVDDYLVEESGPSDRQTILEGIENEDERLSEMPEPRQSALWERSPEAPSATHGKGLPQPVDWHIHDEMTKTIRAKPRKAEQPPIIASDNLWTVTPLKVSTSRSPMWSPINSPSASSFEEDVISRSPSSTSDSEVKTPDEVLPQAAVSGLPLWQVQEQPQRGEHGVGLPHPEDWESYDGVKSTARAKPRQSEPATIESINLWTAAASVLPTPPAKMWASKAQSAPETRTASPVRQVVRHAETSSRALWSAPASPKEVTGSGLFDLGSGRTEFRTTTEAPAALQMERKSRTVVEMALDRLDSTALWASAPAAERERNWLVFRSNQVRTSPRKSSETRQVWSAPAPSKEVSGSGLFDLNSGRTEFRTTPQAPAAIEMSRKSRTPEQKPLEQLTSVNFWVANAETKPERNWLFVGSTPKQLWSAPHSPKDTNEFGMFEANSGRSEFRTTAEAPAALHMDRKSRSLERKPLDELTSSSLWVAEERSEPERNWISPTNSLPQIPTRKATTGSTSRFPAVSAEQWQEALDEALAASYPSASANAASPEQWNQALNEAIAASYPVRLTGARSAPVQASPADWAAALAEAIAKSYGAPFDSSRRHPVFAGSSLTSATRIYHPAATGYTSDVAAVHPVFMGSGAGVAAHPAVPAKATDIVAAQAAIPRQISVRGRNMRGRISAMISKFEDPSPSRIPTMVRSKSRDSSVQPPAVRSVSSSRALSAEPPVAQAAAPQMGNDVDPALLAQIEALEQERIFAEQWTTGALGPVDNTPAQAPAAPAAEEQLFLLEAKTYQRPDQAQEQQPVAPEQPADEEPFVPPMHELRRSDTLRSAVSALSETSDLDRVTLRDSMVSVDSQREQKPSGSRIQFRY